MGDCFIGWEAGSWEGWCEETPPPEGGTLPRISRTTTADMFQIRQRRTPDKLLIEDEEIIVL